MVGKLCKMGRHLGALLVLLSMIFFQNPVAGDDMPEVALFSFGDSDYDAGNKIYVSKNQNPPQTKWPYGKSRDDPIGKFSDGRIIPDFIAQFMDMPYDIPPVFKPGVDILRGASFAVADASLLGSPKESMTLNQQIQKFRNVKSSNWTDDYLQRSLFMIYIGTEDYFNFIKNNSKPDPSAQQAYVTSVTNRLKNDIKLLYSLNARKFAIQNLAPLGCLPMIRQRYITGGECYEPLNDLAKQHNEIMGEMMNDFATQISGFQFTVFDFYKAIMRRTHRNLNYRFYYANSSCCGLGTHRAYGCGMGTVHSELCEYQRSYLFFDGRHNTEKAQEEFAHLYFGANINVVQPMTLRELVVYPVNEPMRQFWSPTVY